MNRKSRLTGIDLFRAIAAYGVVVIHGLGTVPRDYFAEQVTRLFSNFSVPFFLVTAFYFMINSLFPLKRNGYLKSRAIRLLFPYIIWSLIHILARLFKSFILKADSENFSKFIGDPINIIFFGSASVQLYFLPLLFSGTLAAIVITRYLKKESPIGLLLILFILSIITDRLLLDSGNSFQLGKGIAFESLAAEIWSSANMNSISRVVLVNFSWTIRCLPYIFAGIILNESSVKTAMQNYNNKQNRMYLMLFTIAIVCILLLNIPLIVDIAAIILPYTALILGIVLSKEVEANALLENIGYCSFGIYLIHDLIALGFAVVITKVYPGIVGIQLSAIALLLIAGVVFLVSWGATFIISMNKKISTIFLGT